MEVETEIVYEKSDGEVSSDDTDIYTPLERPSFLQQEQVVASRLTYDEISSSESSVASADSDSDSGNGVSPAKRCNKRLKLRPAAKSSSQSKYSVWTAHAHEELLAETMIGCDVTHVDRSRSVESYNYRGFRARKRSFGSRSNVLLRLGKRPDASCDDETKGEVRHLMDLTTTVDSANDEVATDISNKLLEEKDDILKRLVEIVGKAKAIELFLETKRIEADGGMLIMNQTRRRTPGGIYFFLVKRDDDITEEQKRLIFQQDRLLANRAKRKIRKKKNNTSKAPNQVSMLPNLLSRAEIELAKGNRERKESDHTENVSNPPPSPVTDGKEPSSSDELTDQTAGLQKCSLEATPTEQTNSTTHTTVNTRNMQSYEDDFLEIECGNDMDFFS